MEDAVEVLYQVKRLQNDGFLIFVLQYNFRALVDETLTGIEDFPTDTVHQFFQQFTTYEKGNKTKIGLKRNNLEQSEYSRPQNKGLKGKNDPFAFQENIGLIHMSPILFGY